MLKKILIGLGAFIVLILAVALIGGDSGDQVAQNGQQGSAQERQPETALRVSTEDFIAEFDNNQLAAEEKYEGKLVEFTARVKNISEDILGTPFLSLEPANADEFYFGTTIKCEFKEKSALTSLSNGQTITLQGRVNTQSVGIISVESCRVVE